MRTTVGQLMLNEALPEELRDYDRVYDKKSIKTVLRVVAEKYPEQYSTVAQKLMQLGGEIATIYGGVASVSLDSLRVGEKTQKLRDGLRKNVQAILATPRLSHEQRDDMIVKVVGRAAEEIRKVNFAEQLEARNALAMQVNSGARGNPIQFSQTNVGDLLVSDNRDKPVPVALLNSYAEGLDPVEYWAGAYGARKGTISTKMGVPRGGFLAKQLSLAAHRVVVTEDDCDTTNGIPVDADDADNIGALLARNYGDMTANSVITPQMTKQLARHKTVVVRSPMTCEAKGGVCAKCAGVREKGKLPEIGDAVGMSAAQAIAEPVTQSSLSLKHSGGVVGAGHTSAGFDAINSLVTVPKTFQDAAAIATVDGRVTTVENAPQGGKFVVVAGARHYVPPGFELTVKPGDVVEAGDVMSEGLPNPAEIVRYKGVGAGRWHFMNNFRNTLKASKIGANRRNIELLSRGLINHVFITGNEGPRDTLPGDTVEFNTITKGYTVRPGAKTYKPKHAVGRYLEAPALQYSLGTRVTPRIAAELAQHGVDNVTAHDDVPPFVPEMVRAMDTLSYSPDWLVRLGGFHLKKNLLEAVHRGRGAKEHSESYIPSLAKGVEFGKPPAGSGAVY